MRVWAKTYTDNIKKSECIVAIAASKRGEITEEMLLDALAQIAYELDIERPVILSKHRKEIFLHGVTKLLASDFIAETDFDKLVLELIQ